MRIAVAALKMWYFYRNYQSDTMSSYFSEQACNCLLGEALVGEEERKAVGGVLHLPAAQLGVHPAPGQRGRPGRMRCRRGGRGGGEEVEE